MVIFINFKGLMVKKKNLVNEFNFLQHLTPISYFFTDKRLIFLKLISLETVH